MKRLKYITGILFLILSTNIYAGTEIFCKARYLYQIYHPPVPPAYYEGNIIGRIPIAGTGQDAYYENVWSNTYTLNVKFFSGYELNEYYNQNSYNDNAIIAIVSWDDGGYSVITIENWVTNLKSITEEEIKYSSNGERISSMIGYDKEGRYWEFYF
jgi:hypothetical protein